LKKKTSNEKTNSHLGTKAIAPGLQIEGSKTNKTKEKI
jgi:hypothetical protein